MYLLFNTRLIQIVLVRVLKLPSILLLTIRLPFRFPQLISEETLPSKYELLSASNISLRLWNLPCVQIETKGLELLESLSLIQSLFRFMNSLMSGARPFLFLMNPAISLRTSSPALRNIQCILTDTESCIGRIESKLVALSVMLSETDLPVIFSKEALIVFLLFRN